MKSAGKGGVARGGDPLEAAHGVNCHGSWKAAAAVLAAEAPSSRRVMFQCIVQPRHEWPPPDTDNAFPGNRF